MLEDNGATIKMVDVPLVRYVLPYHYSLIPSEAASNLARYDGLRYGFQPSLEQQEKSDLFKYIEGSKTESFGLNVRRRIMLGNFLMSSGGGFIDFNQNLVNA